MIPFIDGVEKPQYGRMWKHFFYSGITFLIMTDFKNKSQNEIAQVKGLSGGHKLGWAKVPVQA